MKWIILITIGIFGGIFGGMGMGGGTLLIPLLTSFGGVSQHAAQGVNLAAFLPMAAVALIIHFKKKLVEAKTALLVALPALLTAVPAAILAGYCSGGVLSRIFGGFLVLLGIWQMVSAIRAKKEP